jgi:hypothetical protein
MAEEFAQCAVVNVRKASSVVSHTTRLAYANVVSFTAAARSFEMSGTARLANAVFTLLF